MVFISAVTAYAIVGGTVTREAGIMPVSATLGDTDPTQTSTCVDLQSDSLRYRANDAITNGEVTILQNFLISTGLLNTSATGYFGLGTFSAVKMFQKRVGINQTGYVGPLTKTKIKEASCALTEDKYPIRYAYDPLPPEVRVAPTSSASQPAACTREVRFCPNGTMMARDTATCKWIESSCFATSTIKIYPGGIACTDVVRYCPTGTKPNPNDPCPCTFGGDRYDQQPQQMEVKPVACTMEARLCPNGTMMARDAKTCAWIPSSCNATTTKVTPQVYYGYDSLPPVKPNNVVVVSGSSSVPAGGMMTVIGATTSVLRPPVCTKEARFCPDGRLMERNLQTCAWIPSSCPSTSAPKVVTPISVVKPGISNVPVVATQTPPILQIPRASGTPFPPKGVFCTDMIRYCPAGTKPNPNDPCPCTFGGDRYDQQPQQQVQLKPVACTMIARLCSDGSMMPRDANCVWYPEKCPASNGTSGGIQCSTDPFSGKPFCGPSTGVSQDI